MDCTDPGFTDGCSLGSPVVMPGGWMLGKDVVTEEVPTIGVPRGPREPGGYEWKGAC